MSNRKPTATTAPNEAPWKKALTRSIASVGTWFVAEYPKLILQQQRQKPIHNSKLHSKVKHPLLVAIDVYKATPMNHHVRGAASSAAQRGSAALIRFYGQAYISRAIYGQDKAPTWWAAGISGTLGSVISSLIQTVFEPAKIRNETPSFQPYRGSLYPMMWRNCLFGGTFFATSTMLQDRNYSYATQFGVSALAASTVNLTHDVWKTQFIKALPNRIKWMSVVQGMTFASFRTQWFAKAGDLGFNWWLTGLLYAYFFAKPKNE